MTGKILFFGRLADAFSAERAFPATQPDSILLSELIDQLAETDEQRDLLRREDIRVAVDQEMVAINTDPHITTEQEIAFLPPMSGG